MLYKNKGLRLSDELFKNPTSEYRAAPFWAWNSKLNEKMLGEQIDCFQKMGFGGFHIHPRIGMDVKYLGKEYMDLVRFCTKTAKEKQMFSYLYDEDKAPSGFAGGLATKEAKYGMKYLLFTTKRIEHAAKNLNVEEEKPCFLAAYDVFLNDLGELKSYAEIDDTAIAHGEKWYAYLVLTPKEPWYNNERYGDLMDNDTVEHFINITYEAYKNAVGDEFGKTVPSFFTDEPLFHQKIPLRFAKQKDDAVFPWTPTFAADFEEKYGYNILSKFPEIVWNLPKGTVSVARYHYHDYVAERLASCFVDALGNWCKKNGIVLTGHMLREATPFLQTESSGDVMRCYRSLGIPGMDLLVNSIELTTAKQCQSVKNQFGYSAMLSELYAATNWDFDFRGHKFQGDWQEALGVTLRVPHLSWTAMKGEAKRDFPAPLNYQVPWCEEYRCIEDHFARINTVLSRGKPVVSVAVIHPLESTWLYFGPTDASSDICKQLDDNFVNFTDWLLRGTVDFDFVNESLLPSQYTESDENFCVGDMKYKVVVIPNCRTLRRSTFEILKKFHSKGGKIIFAGACPQYIDAAPCDDVKELFLKSVCVPFDRASVLQALEDYRILDIFEQNGERTNNLIYNMRSDDDCNWLFIANCVPTACKDMTDAQKLTITLYGCYTPVLYQTLDGLTYPVSYKIENGKTVISITRYMSDSILLRLNHTALQNASADVTEPKNQPFKTIRFLKEVSYKREEDNVLLLDRAEYAIDDGNFNPEEEILILDNICRKEVGLPLKDYDYPQPWTIAEETAAHTLTLRFTIHSETEVPFPKLALEDAEKAQITLNGEAVPSAVCGYFTDKTIQTVALPKIVCGENILTIRIPLGLRTNTEYCYLLGDFNVRLAGAVSYLQPSAKKIGFSDLTAQGMPFYGGNVLYETEVETPECMAEIHLNCYRGALIKVFVDGKDVGKIIFSPYVVKVPLSAGKHKINYLLYGSRVNTFGALHDLTHRYWPGSPVTHRVTNDDYCYEYSLKKTGILASPRIEIYER